MKLKRFQVQGLWVAIAALDGRKEVVKDADGRTMGILTVPYQFANEAAVYALAKTRELIRPEVIATEAAQRAIASQPDAEAKVRAFNCEDVEVEVVRLPAAALNVASNRIPPTVLGDLLPILDGTP